MSTAAVEDFEPASEPLASLLDAVPDEGSPLPRCASSPAVSTEESPVLRLGRDDLSGIVRELNDRLAVRFLPVLVH